MLINCQQLQSLWEIEWQAAASDVHDHDVMDFEECCDSVEGEKMSRSGSSASSSEVEEDTDQGVHKGVQAKPTVKSLKVPESTDPDV